MGNPELPKAVAKEQAKEAGAQHDEVANTTHLQLAQLAEKMKKEQELKMERGNTGIV